MPSYTSAAAALASVICLMIVAASAVSAAPALEIKFHMGIGNGATQSVGGTFVNSGDAAIYRGFLVVTPVDSKCYPGESSIFSIGALQPGEEQQFRVPVAQPFSSYRLSVGAFDEQGFEVSSLDANKALLDERLPEQRDACKKLRME